MPALDLAPTGRLAVSVLDLRDDPDVRQIEQLFARGWRDWTHNGPVSQTTIPDLDFGFTKLRVANIGWIPPYLHATFL